MPRYRRCFEPGQVIFVTVVTADRRKWLKVSGARDLVLRELGRTRAIHPFRNFGHVILEDHFHWLFRPADATQPSRLIASVKRAVTWRGREQLGLKPSLWQPRFFDHVIRNERDLGNHLDYIHFNPVRHGLVRTPAAYPWSSFHALVERGVYDPDWGSNVSEEVLDMDLE